MKQLKAFFEKIGTLPMYGVAYNVQGLTEIKYWDQLGRKNVVSYIPEGMEVGIFIFETRDNELVIVDRTP
ncbi:hypothetical protein OAK75_08695 [Bacteriovoracales bacterium]|nr:hypothetical protein [Bacteriovoracales bacterium]